MIILFLMYTHYLYGFMGARRRRITRRYRLKSCCAGDLLHEQRKQEKSAGLDTEISLRWFGLGGALIRQLY